MKETESIKIAHTCKNEKTDEYKIQTIEEHLQGTTDLAYAFGKVFQGEEWTSVVASLHDIGKYSLEFQKYIRSKSGINKEPYNHKIDHASAGAIISKKIYPEYYPILAQCIAGHHSGLLDQHSLENRLSKPLSNDIDSESLIREQLQIPNNLTKYNYNHWIRMIFSCLVDADYLDTERFMNEQKYKFRYHHKPLTELKEKLDSYIKQLKDNAINSELNSIRDDIQQESLKASQWAEGIYSMTVPTGGGKTLSSIVWALNHAIKYNKTRIIIAIPYTSIIVQTASTLKKIFGEENVLEHHSNVELVGEAKLASENWDYPIIVTTNVQLFESIFANKTSRCRKLHNICNSVIILDEVQMLPINLLNPIITALKVYNQFFHASLLLTTASFPAITDAIGKGKEQFTGLENVREIIPDINSLFKKMRRVEIAIRQNIQTYDQIAEELLSHNQVLCIVNSRKEAHEIYDKLPHDQSTIHLSRMMTSEHILNQIKYIKKTLKDGSKTKLRVVSTQLIEAGVDIDFPVVYRSMTGLDSIIQAAGRCNREGKLQKGKAIVFRGEKKTPPGLITKGKDTLDEILEVNPNIDIQKPETMKKYFDDLFGIRVNTFDKPCISKLLYIPMPQFEEAAHKFKMINDDTFTIFMNYGKGLKYINILKAEGVKSDILRKMQRTSVSVQEKDFNELKRTGRITELFENVWIQNDPNLYDEHVGLVMENKWLEETYII
jgi:CRISPR-associated endonuclease/helicase Cas3